ncbi:MAG: Acylphosphatase [Syntrophus sp. SKADARSKE-3]|nr:Acylphosphatase [Syntrophus sp. SKADARSKE-3]
MDKPINKRLHVVISGRVQGVNFRAYTKRTAVSLGLTGWVKNLASGQVESVFEGPDQAVGSMLAWCHEGPPLSRVDHVYSREEPFTGSFPDFRILY